MTSLHEQTRSLLLSLQELSFTYLHEHELSDLEEVQLLLHDGSLESPGVQDVAELGVEGTAAAAVLVDDVLEQLDEDEEEPEQDDSELQLHEHERSQAQPQDGPESLHDFTSTSLHLQTSFPPSLQSRALGGGPDLYSQPHGAAGLGANLLLLLFSVLRQNWLPSAALASVP